MIEATVVAASVAAGSLLKGITGVGGPILAIPVMAALLGVEHAVVVMAIPGVLMNVWLILRHRRATSSTRDLPLLTVAGVIGVGLGTLGLATLNDRLLSAGLAVAIVGYILVRLRRPTFEISPRTSRVVSPFAGATAGALQGATGISAPVVAMYVHGLNLSRQSYIFSVAVLFGLFSVAHVVAIAALGLYTAELLFQSGVAAVPAVGLLPLGDRIGARLTPHRFDQVLLASLAALAVKLLYDTFAP